jgi:hypothetical protein
MLNVLIALLNIGTVQAWDVGNLQYCLVDDYNNRECYYYTYSACQTAAQNSSGKHCEKK